MKDPIKANPIFKNVINDVEPDYIKRNRIREYQKELDDNKIRIVVLEGDNDTFTRKIGRLKKPKQQFMEEISKKSKGKVSFRKSECKGKDTNETEARKRQSKDIDLGEYYSMTTDANKTMNRI